MSERPTKLSSDLNYYDYISHPIWGFWDDDGDEVMMVDYPGCLIWPSGGEALWVRCDFTLKDGTKQPGVVGVRMTNQTIYLLEFAGSDNELFVFPVNSLLEGSVTLEQLAQHLGKPVDAIFPIRYSTPYVFKNHMPLTGVYEWTNKNR